MNKLTIALCCLMAMPLGLHAQTEADTSVLEVHYKASYKQAVNDSTLKEDEKALLIGERQSLFYSIRKRRADAISDSLARVKASPMEIVSMVKSDRMPRGGEDYEVMTNHPKEGQLTLVTQVLTDWYGVEEPMDQMEWQLVEGDTIVATYACQKAQTTWRGRRWTAWYALDLPFSCGPWKLCGLPGLILSAHDDSGIYSFDCYEVLQGKGEPLALSLSKYVKATQKDMQRLRAKALKDPTDMLRQRYGASVTIVSVDDSGKKIDKWIGYEPSFMELFEKK